MRASLLFIMLLSTISAYAQKDTIGLNLPLKEGRIIYEEIIQQPDKSKTDLLNNARQWFVDYFKSSKDVIQNEDKDQGRIIGKGIILVSMKYFVGIYTYDEKITIQIDCKDGKYRYRIYDMIIIIPASYNSIIGAVPESQFAPEDMIAKLNGTGKIGFKKVQCRRLLESISTETQTTIQSLKKAMAAKTDNF